MTVTTARRTLVTRKYIQIGGLAMISLGIALSIIGVYGLEKEIEEIKHNETYSVKPMGNMQNMIITGIQVLVVGFSLTAVGFMTKLRLPM